MTTLWREFALASAVVAAIIAGWLALGYFAGLPPSLSQADVGKCAVEMIENRRVIFGPAEKCAAYVKPISVQVRSRGERFGDFLLSSFIIKVDTTVQIKKG
jgi:hypothetical protein